MPNRSGFGLDQIWGQSSTFLGSAGCAQGRSTLPRNGFASEMEMNPFPFPSQIHFHLVFWNFKIEIFKFWNFRKFHWNFNDPKPEISGNFNSFLPKWSKNLISRGYPWGGPGVCKYPVFSQFYNSSHEIISWFFRKQLKFPEISGLIALSRLQIPSYFSSLLEIYGNFRKFPEISLKFTEISEPAPWSWNFRTLVLSSWEILLFKIGRIK